VPGLNYTVMLDLFGVCGLLFCLWVKRANVNSEPRTVTVESQSLLEVCKSEADFRGHMGMILTSIKTTQPTGCEGLWTCVCEPYRMSDSSCARQRARSSTFIVSESLFPIISDLMENTTSKFLLVNYTRLCCYPNQLFETNCNK